MKKQDILQNLDFRAFYSGEIPSLKINGKAKVTCLCPFHDDHNPSLSINLDTGRWKCFTGCGGGDVFNFYQEKHGVDFKTALNEIVNKHGITFPAFQHTMSRKGGKVVATFEYKDATGKVIYAKQRIEPGKTRPKDFIFKHPNGGGWGKGRGCEAVLYRLPELVESDYIIVVEGEAKADLLNQWGLVATCLDSGALSTWKEHYLDTLTGKQEIIILPDNDSPGMDYAITFAKALYGNVGAIRIIELPGLSDKEDILDWSKVEGNDKEKLFELIENSPEWHSQSECQHLVSVKDILNADAESFEWVVDSLIPEGAITLLSAPPSHFKTWCALDIARCVSEGIPFLGRSTKQHKVYYIDRENPRNVLRRYFMKLGLSDTTPMEVWPLWIDEEPPVFPYDLYQKYAKERPLIVFDSLIRFYPKGTDENQSTHISPVMNFLKSLTKVGATVIILHHAGKAEGSNYRGSSDILGGVDIAYTMKKSEGGSSLTLKCIKSRYGEEEDIPIEVISDDVSLRFEDATHKRATEREQAEEENILAIREVLVDLARPNQSELLKSVKDRLGLSKHDALPLLSKGKDKVWTVESEGPGRATHYAVI